MSRIEREPYHWPVGRTLFAKLAYFATKAGLPTGNNFAQSSYGPYSPALKGRIAELVNNGLIREERIGKMFHITTGITSYDARLAYQGDIAQSESTIGNLADLFLRMDTRRRKLRLQFILRQVNCSPTPNQNHQSDKS